METGGYFGIGSPPVFVGGMGIVEKGLEIMDFRNIKLTIAYDGTDFSGFQRQAKGERTVQGVLERALYRITGEDKTPQVNSSRADGCPSPCRGTSGQFLQRAASR